MKRIVGVAEMIVSASPNDTLITYALGPCLGVAVSDLCAGVGGLIHCQLPVAASGAGRKDFNPIQYVDSGVSAMLEAMFALGADIRKLSIKVAGGANVLDDLNVFKIAERNYTVLRKMLWKNNLLIVAEDVGGSNPRTMRLHVGTGEVVIQAAGTERVLGVPACSR